LGDEADNDRGRMKWTAMRDDGGNTIVSIRGARSSVKAVSKAEGASQVHNEKKDKKVEDGEKWI
jgi:hypothetical protein